MRLKRRRLVRAAMRAFMLGLIFVLVTIQALPCALAATSDECISELAVAVGQDGIAQLEEDGFTVMMRPLCEGGEAYLAYKCGGTPITGVAVGSSAGGLSIDGVGYDLVANVDVCAGVSDARYVYATHDKSAGTGILLLKLESGGGHVDDVPFAIKNDGLSPVRDEQGHVAVLGANVPSYLYMLHKQVCRPYVGEACAVSGKDLRNAVLAAANLGYDYYYDTGLKTTKGDYVVLGYTRTKSADDAITCVTARPAKQKSYKVGGVSFDLMGNVTIDADEPYRLFCTKDPLAGNPIMDFTGSDVPVRATDVVGKWVDRTFVKFASASAGNEAKAEKLYGELLASKDALTNVAVYMANDTSATKGSEDKKESKDAADAADDKVVETEDADAQDTLELGTNEGDDASDTNDAKTQDDDAALELEDAADGEPEQVELLNVEVESNDEATDEADEQDVDVATQSSRDVEDDSKEDPLASVPKTRLAYVCVAKDLPTSLFVPAKSNASASTAKSKKKDTKEDDKKKDDASSEDKDAKKDEAQSIELAADDANPTDTSEESEATQIVSDDQATTQIESEEPAVNELVSLEEVQSQDEEQPQQEDDSTGQDLVMEDAEYVDEGEEVVLVASTFGDGMSSTLLISGGMAAAGALGGLGVYKVRRRREGGERNDEQD